MQVVKSGGVVLQNTAFYLFVSSPRVEQAEKFDIFCQRQHSARMRPVTSPYHDQDQLTARHVRCYDRRQDIEDPDHPKALIAQCANAREQRLWLRFLSLSPKAQTYYDGLEQRRANARHHLRKIVALSDIYGTEPVARAIEDALVFHASVASTSPTCWKCELASVPPQAPCI